ncbi:hypothetical protein LY76DRAFT_640087 [Colletotrichum caudatum]|nr:hypothetical protein LY76DRAFT_640087 [Colletotrichum caudatum]
MALSQTKAALGEIATFPSELHSNTDFKEAQSLKSLKEAATAKQPGAGAYLEPHFIVAFKAPHALGFAPSNAQVREMAQRVLEARGDSQPFGKILMEGSLRRNLIMKDFRAKKIAEAKKAKEATMKTLAELMLTSHNVPGTLVTRKKGTPNPSRQTFALTSIPRRIPVAAFVFGLAKHCPPCQAPG